MTIPQPPFGGPAGYQAPGPVPPTGRKRGNPFTSRPGIGVMALVAGIALGAGATAGAGQTATAGLQPAPTVTVTATTTATPPPPATGDDEPVEQTVPADEPTPTPDPTPDPTPEPIDTSFKWGKKGRFLYEEVEITVKIDKPKASANMFDKDNLEAKLTVCNEGTETIQELSANGMGLYAEDKQGGQYSLYGPYRSPEFPIYTSDSAKLKAGKCRTGWISFEDARKAVRISLDIDDETYSWSKSGK